MPVIADKIINLKCKVSLKIRRVMCGTAMPVNAIGPQKDVVSPVNRPVKMNILSRVLFTLMPRVCAFSSPR